MESTFASTIKNIISIANKTIYQIKCIAIMHMLESQQKLIKEIKVKNSDCPF